MGAIANSFMTQLIIERPNLLAEQPFPALDEVKR